MKNTGDLHCVEKIKILCLFQTVWLFLMFIKIMHYHANGHFDWRSSGQQSYEMTATLKSGKDKG